MNSSDRVGPEIFGHDPGYLACERGGNMRAPAETIVDRIKTITDDLVAQVQALTFAAPVTHVYNPLVYARNGYDRYLHRYGNTTKTTLLVGMNPGPFGMAQTGVPFGDVQMVTQWLGISGPVGQPAHPHPKRPVDGFGCRRREVSGQRLWTWAAQRFGSPRVFFKRFFVVNYCPLVFMEGGGRNRTPEKLPAAERERLFAVCDQALRRTVAVFEPCWVVGVGAFAARRVREIAVSMPVGVGQITHPSPANPRANRGWAELVAAEMRSIGIDLD
jgi:single-strand selective monofunctional uracil DNA glycosylase